MQSNHGTYLTAGKCHSKSKGSNPSKITNPESRDVNNQGWVHAWQSIWSTLVTSLYIWSYIQSQRLSYILKRKMLVIRPDQSRVWVTIKKIGAIESYTKIYVWQCHLHTNLLRTRNSRWHFWVAWQTLTCWCMHALALLEAHCCVVWNDSVSMKWLACYMTNRIVKQAWRLHQGTMSLQSENSPTTLLEWCDSRHNAQRYTWLCLDTSRWITEHKLLNTQTLRWVLSAHFDSALGHISHAACLVVANRENPTYWHLVHVWQSALLCQAWKFHSHPSHFVLKAHFLPGIWWTDCKV